MALELDTSLSSKELLELTILAAQQPMGRVANRAKAQRRFAKALVEQFGAERADKMIEAINGLKAYGSVDQLIRDAIRDKYPALDIPRINPAFGRETLRKDGSPTIVNHDSDPSEDQEDDVQDQDTLENQTGTEGQTEDGGKAKGGGRTSRNAGKTYRLTGTAQEDGTVLNPARAGTKRHSAYAIFASAGEAGASYEAYREAGGSLHDLELGLEKGFIVEVA